MNVYDKLKNGSSEYKKIVGKNSYQVRHGVINPTQLHLEPVDANAGTGNPRFFTIHKTLLTIDPKHGPITEEEQFNFFTSPPGSVGKVFEGPDHRKTHQKYTLLKNGLEITGESQDDIHITWDGGVLEGNRRLVAARELGWKSIRVICYPKEIERDDVLTLLVRRHVIPPAKWASADQVQVLAMLKGTKKSPKEIAAELGMQESKVRKIFLMDSYLRDYQQVTEDCRPEKFSVFWKIAGNRKLRNMLYLNEKNEASTPDKNGLGGYDQNLRPRFYEWITKDKVTARNDIDNMTNDKIGLLRYPHLMVVIDTHDATEATNMAKRGDIGRPGIKSIEHAVADLDKLSGMDAEKLAADKDYVDQLIHMHQDLARAISRFATMKETMPKIRRA